MSISASNPRTVWAKPAAERKSLIAACHSRELSEADGAIEGCVPTVAADSGSSQLNNKRLGCNKKN